MYSFQLAFSLNRRSDERVEKKVTGYLLQVVKKEVRETSSDASSFFYLLFFAHSFPLQQFIPLTAFIYFSPFFHSLSLSLSLPVRFFSK